MDEFVPGPQGKRRLVIMGVENHTDPTGGTKFDEMSGDDVSDGDDGPISASQNPDPAVRDQAERLAASFEWLASMDLESPSTQPPCRMKFVPGYMEGSYRATMRVALNAIDEGRSLNSMLRISRGWRSFLILPQLLLHRLPRV